MTTPTLLKSDEALRALTQLEDRLIFGPVELPGSLDPIRMTHGPGWGSIDIPSKSLAVRFAFDTGEDLRVLAERGNLAEHLSWAGIVPMFEEDDLPPEELQPSGAFPVAQLRGTALGYRSELAKTVRMYEAYLRAMDRFLIRHGRWPSAHAFRGAEFEISRFGVTIYWPDGLIAVLGQSLTFATSALWTHSPGALCRGWLFIDPIAWAASYGGEVATLH